MAAKWRRLRNLDFVRSLQEEVRPISIKLIFVIIQSYMKELITPNCRPSRGYKMVDATPDICCHYFLRTRATNKKNVSHTGNNHVT